MTCIDLSIVNQTLMSLCLLGIISHLGKDILVRGSQRSYVLKINCGTGDDFLLPPSLSKINIFSSVRLCVWWMFMCTHVAFL